MSADRSISAICSNPRRDPDKVALIAADGAGGHRSTHLSRRSAAPIAALAASLSRRGLERGARIALIGANSAEYLVAYFAIMRAGLVAVPVNTRLPDATIAFILDDAAAEFAFAETRYQPILPAGFAAEAFAAIAAGRPATDFATVTPAPHEVAMVLYTSGSTGRPKGVALSHAGPALGAAHPPRRARRAGSASGCSSPRRSTT